MGSRRELVFLGQRGLGLPRVPGAPLRLHPPGRPRCVCPLLCLVPLSPSLCPHSPPTETFGRPARRPGPPTASSRGACLAVPLLGVSAAMLRRESGRRQGEVGKEVASAVPFHAGEGEGVPERRLLLEGSCVDPPWPRLVCTPAPTRGSATQRRTRAGAGARIRSGEKKPVSPGRSGAGRVVTPGSPTCVDHNRQPPRFGRVLQNLLF